MKRSRRRRRIYQLSEFKLIGFAMQNTLGGTTAPILTRAVISSDHPFFHHCMRAFSGEVDAMLRAQDTPMFLSQASNFAIVIDQDRTAKLYVDCVELVLEMVAKRAVEKGEAVWSNDIGDIYQGSIRFPRIRPDQHYIVCLRHEWKFLLLFDLTPEQPANLADLSANLGFGMRRLLFAQLYDTMADERVLGAMIEKGWFPFNELIGAEFEGLQKAIADDFNVDAVERGLIEAFNSTRTGRLLDRWWRNPHYAARRELLSEGVALFLEGRFIPSIKTLLTEVEGILRDHHVARTMGRQGIHKVLAVAFEEVLRVAGADTIYFPQQFVAYLQRSVFADFDPGQRVKSATRNTVSHGRAPGAAYTAVRALQTILVLDQINLYLTLPAKPKAKRNKQRDT